MNLIRNSMNNQKLEQHNVTCDNFTLTSFEKQPSFIKQLLSKLDQIINVKEQKTM